MTTDKIDPACWWRMQWLKNADNRAAQNKSLKEELHSNAVPSPPRPPTPLPKYSAVRHNNTTNHYHTTDNTLVGAALGYWAASGSSSSGSNDSSYDSGSSDSGGSFGGD